MQTRRLAYSGRYFHSTLAKGYVWGTLLQTVTRRDQPGEIHVVRAACNWSAETVTHGKSSVSVVGDAKVSKARVHTVKEVSEIDSQGEHKTVGDRIPGSQTHVRGAH